ncbi:MAG TPA: YdcF family protein, partial [Tahibacter sp.]|nr:YdcF family protein [Tahibacter sp.]
ADPSRRVLLLGGAADGGMSEAAAAFARLHDLGLPPGVAPLCEDASTDTLENLRNARALLGSEAREPVALVSSRYHLARCMLLARALGFDAEPVAADARFSWRPRLVLRLVLEAGYCLWVDTGTRWARLIGNRRMLDRVT